MTSYQSYDQCYYFARSYWNCGPYVVVIMYFLIKDLYVNLPSGRYSYPDKINNYITLHIKLLTSEDINRYLDHKLQPMVISCLGLHTFWDVLFQYSWHYQAELHTR